MTFKTFLAEALILEGGAAIKGSHQLTQAEAREVISAVIHDLKVMLKLPSNKIATIGSAGIKPGDQLSGDIDIAVEADVTAVKKAVEELALDGRFRHMPGLNVYSYARLHGSKVAQVDIIPTTSIKLAKWAYYNDPGDMKLGLKGSHRNELLFAIAKFAELESKGKAPDGTDSARIRLVFDLSRGLYRYTQDRAGKRGLKKSFSTVSKELITSDPDQICERLFGRGITASRVMTFHDALKLMLAPSFKHKAKLKQIIDRAISGLEGKKLVVPHELRVAIINEATSPKLKQTLFMFQQQAIDFDFDLGKFADELETELKLVNSEPELHITFPEHYNVKVNVYDGHARTPSLLMLIAKIQLLDVNDSEQVTMTQRSDGKIAINPDHQHHLTICHAWEEAGEYLMRIIKETIDNMSAEPSNNS
jgi:hypothetical protein